MSFHLNYRLPGYPSLQVERFATLSEAERRYDELAANTDVEALTQPFDNEAVASQPGGGVQVSVTITASSPVWRGAVGMWLIDFLKSLFAAYSAGKAAKAAADLPAGQKAVDQIEADGKAIEAQLAGNKSAAAK